MLKEGHLYRRGNIGTTTQLTASATRSISSAPYEYIGAIAGQGNRTLEYQLIQFIEQQQSME